MSRLILSVKGQTETFRNLAFAKNCTQDKPEDQWSCIAHVSAKDMLQSAVIEEKKFENIESD